MITVEWLNDYLNDCKIVNGFKDRAKKIECKDGAVVSIQASEFHYSNPRENTADYEEIEAGFPTVTPPLSWHEYAEDKDDLCGTVYGYMPIAIAVEFVNDHGGLK